MMASASAYKRSSNTSLLCKDPGLVAEFSCISTKNSSGRTSVQRDLEALSLRNASHKSKKKKKNEERHAFSEGCGNRRYMKCVGCRVCACSEFGAHCQRRLSSASEDCLPRSSVLDVDGTGMDCFSYAMPERFWKKNSGNAKEVEHISLRSAAEISLPDDVMEMILVRLPLTTLLTARQACKKWRLLTSTPHFMQMRSNSCYQTPWLFLFGIMRDGRHTGDIHALDVSVGRWHRISHEALRGRFLFSVASIRTDIYIVGGCSISTNLSLPLERSSFKTHKGVLVFDPLTGSWHKATPMNSARSGAILGVFEVSPTCSIFCSRPERHDRFLPKCRVGGVSDVYEDPHRFSVRRQLRAAFIEDDDAHEPKRKLVKSARQGGDLYNKKFALIAVGGRGSWDEPLDSGEVYDPLTDRWVEIAKLPADLGAVCSGAVCCGKFYVYSDADKLAAYDLERDYWVLIQTTQPPPRLREYYPKLVSCNSRLFMLCVSWCDRNGQVNRREKAARKLWELDLGFHVWTEKSRHPDAPMDWNATFVADASMIYGVEMFKIFGQTLDFLTVCEVTDDAEFKWSRISKKHAAPEGNVSSCTIRSLVVLKL